MMCQDPREGDTGNGNGRHLGPYDPETGGGKGRTLWPVAIVFGREGETGGGPGRCIVTWQHMLEFGDDGRDGETGKGGA